MLDYTNLLYKRYYIVDIPVDFKIINMKTIYYLI